MQRLLRRIEEETVGGISTTPEDLTFYSTDGSIFELTPTAIFYPKDTIDLQNLVKIIADEAVHGHYLPITARGRGTDQGGGPLGTGLILDFTKHMNHILEIGDDYVVVQPGVRYGHLQDELKKRGRYIPAYPASIEICTIGGAVANNSAGEKTVKYGATRNYVESLEVILANGQIISTSKLDGYHLGAKKRQHDLEGDIYRRLDDLISENLDYIRSEEPHVTKNASGYALWEVDRYNHFDLGQLFTGSQGTLGLITKIKLRTSPVPDPKQVILAVSHYETLHAAGEAIQKINKLDPSALEVVDSNLLSMVLEQNPQLLKGLLPDTMPAIVLLTEFDDEDKELAQQKLNKAKNIFNEHAFEWVEKNDPEDQARLWKLRRSAAAVMWTIPGTKKALPIIEDGVVPPEKIVTFFEKAYEIFEKYDLDIAVWGHAGDANLHMQPFMDLGKKEDREKVFNVTDDFYNMVIELGGSVSAEHNDGIMRSPYLPKLYGEKMCHIFDVVKYIFDPHNILNPHKKVGVDFNYAKRHVRHEYTINSLKRTEEVDR